MTSKIPIKFTRLDVSTIITLLVGMLLGGMLVYGLTYAELDRERGHVSALGTRIHLLELEVEAMSAPRVGAP